MLVSLVSVLGLIACLSSVVPRVDGFSPSFGGARRPQVIRSVATEEEVEKVSRSSCPRLLYQEAWVLSEFLRNILVVV
jgi:hypothetical protein